MKNIRNLYEKLPSLDSKKYTSEYLIEAYTRLLLNLSQEQTKFVISSDKRLLEKYLLIKIKKIDSLTEVLNQYNKYVNSPILSKRRIGSFFKEPDYANSLINIIQALQQRALEIVHLSYQQDKELESLKNSELFSPKHLRKGVSKEQYTSLTQSQATNTKVYVPLLLNLPEIETKFITSNDKRILEKHLLNEIKKINSLTEIFHQYDKYFKNPSLSKRRTGSFFKDPDYSDSLKKVIQALQHRSLQLVHMSCQRDEELENLKNSELFSPKHLKKGVLKEQYELLMKLETNHIHYMTELN